MEKIHSKIFNLVSILAATLIANTSTGKHPFLILPSPHKKGVFPLVNYQMKKEETPLVRLFGDSAFVRVLNTLLDHTGHEYTKKELAEVTDISRQTLYNIWDKLEELEIVTETRKIGNTQLYKLNEDSKLVERIYEFDQGLMEDNEVRKTLEIQ